MGSDQRPCLVLRSRGHCQGPKHWGYGYKNSFTLIHIGVGLSNFPIRPLLVGVSHWSLPGGRVLHLPSSDWCILLVGVSNPPLPEWACLATSSSGRIPNSSPWWACPSLAPPPRGRGLAKSLLDWPVLTSPSLMGVSLSLPPWWACPNHPFQDGDKLTGPSFLVGVSWLQMGVSSAVPPRMGVSR